MGSGRGANIKGGEWMGSIRNHQPRGICIDCKKNPARKGKRCPSCSLKHYVKMKDKQNEDQKAARAAARAANPPLCADGCGRLAVGRSPTCNECRKIRQQGYKLKTRTRMKAEKLVAITPP